MPPPVDHRAVTRILQTVSFTSSFDRVLIAPLLIGIAHEFGIGLAAASVAATTHFVAYGSMQLVWAFLSDKYGRVAIMRWSLALAGAAGALAFVAPTFVALVVARTLAGGSYAAGIPGALTYVGDTVPIERRQGPLTDLMRGTALGTAAGVVGGGLLAEFVSWRVAFLGVGVAAVLLALLVGRLPEPGQSPREGALRSLTMVLRNRWALLVMLLGAGEGIALLAILTFLPAALEDVAGTSASVAGGVVAGYGLAILVITPTVKAISLHRSPSALIGGGALPNIAALICFTTLINPVGVFVGSALLGLGWALVHSTIQTWATEVAPKARATAVSLFAASLFTGSALGSAIGGWILASGTYRQLFAIFLVVGAAVMLVAWTGRRRYTIAEKP